MISIKSTTNSKILFVIVILSYNLYLQLLCYLLVISYLIFIMPIQTHLRYIMIRITIQATEKHGYI